MHPCGVPEVRLRKLQHDQNSAARLITRTRMRESITPQLKALHWLPVVKRIEYKTAVITYRCLNNTAPIYLWNLIYPYAAARSGPTRAAKPVHLSNAESNLEVPRYSSKSFGGRSFQCFAPALWNSLPLSVKNSATLVSFRSSLKTYLFSSAFPTWFDFETGSSAPLTIYCKRRYTNRIHYYYYYYCENYIFCKSNTIKPNHFILTSRGERGYMGQNKNQLSRFLSFLWNIFDRYY